MKVLVNEQPVDFTLEKDVSLGELIRDIQKWAQDQNHYVLNYSVDPEKGFENSPELKSSEIANLRVEVGSHFDLLRENIAELIEYMDRAGIFLAGKVSTGTETIATADAEALAEGAHWLNDAMESLLKQAAFPEGEKADVIRLKLNSLLNGGELMAILECMGELKDVFVLWQKMLKFSGISAEEKQALADAALVQLPLVSGRLEDVAVHFSTGEEAKALAGLEVITDFISDAVSLLQGSGRHEEAVGRLVKLLGELTVNLMRQDYVTAADIVDFDLKEALQQLAAA